MIHLVRTLSSSAHSLSPRLATLLDQQQLSCAHHVLPATNRSTSRWVQRLQQIAYSELLDRWFSTRIRGGDTVWIYGSVGLAASHARLERRVRKRGAKLLFWLTDAWHLQSQTLQKLCAERVALADLTGLVTPQLQESFQQEYPAVKCVLLEEACDTDVLRPMPQQALPNRTIVWTGRIQKVSDLDDLLPVLAEVYSEVPFEFRIVSGARRPSLELPIPWSWVPHSTSDEAANLGQAIAVAYYPDTPYGRCKGNYKVKTCMAAGCAVVTSAVGYNHTMIQHEHNGLLVRTPDDWRAALLDLLGHPEKARALGKNARQTAVERYSYAALLSSYIAALNSLQN